MKKIKNISVIILFGLSFLIHFAYDKFPSTLTLIISPVNESIFEHMKLFITSMLIYSLFEILYFMIKNIHINNYFTSIFISSILGIIFYLIIFIPVYLIIDENMVFTFILLFIAYFVMSRISLYIYNMKQMKILNYVSILLIILTYVIFAYLSYNPPKNFLFYDTENDKYGINEYKI